MESGITAERRKGGRYEDVNRVAEIAKDDMLVVETGWVKGEDQGNSIAVQSGQRAWVMRACVC